MCLGDLRFMPWVKWRWYHILAPGAGNLAALPANTSRVGVAFFQDDNAVQTWLPVHPDNQNPGSLSGIRLNNNSTGTEGYFIGTYQQYGELIQVEWQVRAFAVMNIVFADAVVPQWVMDEIRKLGPGSPPRYP